MSTKKKIKAVFIAKTTKEAKLLSKAEDMALFIYSLDNIRRKHLKYSSYSDEIEDVLETVFEDINEAICNYNIVIEDLID